MPWPFYLLEVNFRSDGMVSCIQTIHYLSRGEGGGEDVGEDHHISLGERKWDESSRRGYL